MKRVGLRHASFLPFDHLIHMSTNFNLIPARASPGLTRSALPVLHQGRSVKLATGAKTTLRGRNNISVGTWNVRTLHAAGRLEQLTHELNKYRWHLLGLCEVRCKHSGVEKAINSSTVAEKTNTSTVLAFLCTKILSTPSLAVSQSRVV